MNDLKINMINDGKSPIIEKDLDEYIANHRNEGLIEATDSCDDAILNTDLSIVCVGTPSKGNGAIDLSYIYQTCEQIGTALKKKDTFHTIVIRSTVTPGTVAICGELIAKYSGKEINKDFGVGSNPEFLREGTAIFDFWNPPYTIIGTNSEKSMDLLENLYSEIDAPIFKMKPEESEFIKYANNNFHALKVTFANEIGNICKELNVDSHKVMEVVTADTKLNLSPYYMKPGFAFGGSCLPKDVRGLTYKSKSLDLNTPLLNSLIESNEYQIKRGLDFIYDTGRKKIGFLGFAFKNGTDDLRESPVVTLIETLLGKGYELAIYDSNVLLSKVMGKNKDYLMDHIPHISGIIKESMDEVIRGSDVIVIGNKAPEFKNIIDTIPEDKIILDLVRIDNNRVSEGNYVGICW